MRSFRVRGKTVFGFVIVVLLLTSSLSTTLLLFRAQMTQAQPGGWWDTSWQYRKEVTVDSTKVDADLNNFPVLIDITDSDLASKAQGDGDDIAFTNEAGAQLSHEIESYNGSTGDLVAWVRANLSSTTDTTLYMYYGHLGASNQQNPTGVWDSNYVLVQHLNETSGTHYDSTSYENDGAPSGGLDQDAAGEIDGADYFDGTDDYVRVPNNSSLQFGEGSFTAEAWVKPATGLAVGRVVNNRGTGSWGGYKGWQIMVQQSGSQWFLSGSGIDDATGSAKPWSGGSTYTYDEWHYVVMVYEADNQVRYYVDGNLDTTVAVGAYGSITNTLPTAIGAAIAHQGSEGTYAQHFDGIIDEVRLSNVSRSVSWISTQYNNQHSPSTFHTFGTEETVYGPPIISNEIPQDSATGVELNPTLQADITDILGDSVDWLIATNASGSWVTLNSGTLHSGIGTVSTSTTNMDSYSTKYWWSVNATDPEGSGEWTNQTFSFTTQLEPAVWWDTDWPHRKNITIDHSKVPADLSNFPVLINIADDDLASKAQDDGNDIVFTDYFGVKLDHEIESYNSSTGHLVAWVSANLSSTAETVLYLYYGNAGASNQENPSSVWDPSYVGVWHLSETSGTQYDSTANDNDGTPIGASGIANGTILWSNTTINTHRGVVKDGRIYVGGGTESPARNYMFIFNLTTGEVIAQSPGFGNTHSTDTAPVVDGEIVYGAGQGGYGDGYVVAWNVTSNSIIWDSSSSFSNVWSSYMEFDGTYLYISLMNYTLVKVDKTDGSVVDTFNLDYGNDEENCIPPYLDEVNDVIFAVGNTTLHKINATDFTEIWNITIGTVGMGSGCSAGETTLHTRQAIIVVNDTYTNNEPWVICGCKGNKKIFAFDYNGNQIWNRTIEPGLRATPAYNPNTGYLYVPHCNYEEFNVHPGKIWVLNITDGSGVFNVTDRRGLPFSRPCTIAGDYLLFKTTSRTQKNYVYVHNATTGEYIGEMEFPLGAITHCYPLAVSGGYVVNGGSGSVPNGGAYVWHAGEGELVDFYPLYGPYKYGYIENALTSYGIPVSGLSQGIDGQIDGADQFDGSTGYLETTTLGNFGSQLNTHTIETWIRWSHSNAWESPYGSKVTTGTQLHFHINRQYDLASSPGDINYWITDENGNPLSAGTSGKSYNDGQWHHVVWVISDSSNNQISLYVDGAPVTLTKYREENPSNFINLSHEMVFGARNTEGTIENFFEGYLDEVRVSNASRSAEWIEACYNNQHSPSTFYTVGSEETIRIPGDLDKDGDVDSDDLLIFAGTYGTSPPANPDCDIDGDGDVDVDDFYILARNYGKTT